MKEIQEMSEKEIQEMSEFELREVVKNLKVYLTKLRWLRQLGYARDGEPISVTIKISVAHRKKCEALLKEIRQINNHKDI